MKEVNDFKYDEWDCDDIGRFYCIDYVCPYCNLPVHYGNLKSYGEDIDLEVNGIVIECDKCGNNSRIICK